MSDLCATCGQEMPDQPVRMTESVEVVVTVNPLVADDELARAMREEVRCARF